MLFQKAKVGFSIPSTLDGRVFLYVHVRESAQLCRDPTTPETISTSLTFPTPLPHFTTPLCSICNHFPQASPLSTPCYSWTWCPPDTIITFKLNKHWESVVIYYNCCQLTNIWCFMDLYDFSQIKISCYNSHLGKQVKKKGTAIDRILTTTKYYYMEKGRTHNPNTSEHKYIQISH